MTFIKSIRQDNQRRIIYAQKEWKRQSLKCLLNDVRVPLSIRLQLFFKYENFLISLTSTRIRNRCILTGRSRAVLRPFRVSRNLIKKLGSQGLFPGLRQST